MSTKQCMKLVFIINTGAILLVTLLLSLSQTAIITYATRPQVNDIFNRHQRGEISTTITNNSEPLGTTLSPYWAIFRNAYSDEEMKVHIQLMDVFDAAMRNASIPYFMYSGTLIGSWRHHGQISWDDDVDLVVPIGQQTRVINALIALSPTFRIDTQSAIRWKFYSSKSSIVPMTNHGWPYIDINFYYCKTTHVWDADKPGFPQFCFSVDMIFPLRERPFMDRMFLAPAKTENVLKKTYDLSVCLTGDWDHRKEQWRAGTDQDKVTCTDLKDLHPFVRRTRIKNRGCNETLMYNSIVNSWYLNEHDEC